MIITIPMIVLMCIVFVLVFLFIKTIDKRKWLTFIISIVLTPVIYFYLVYPMINIFSNYHHKKYFSAELWKEKPALRYEISDDMLTSKVLLNKSKSEISATLGEYEWLSWDSLNKVHDQNKWNYNLGIEPGAFNKQKECIEIIFKSDTVTAINTFKEVLTFDEKE